MYSEPDSMNAGADSFLVRDQSFSGGDTAVYSVRMPDSELQSIPNIEINLLLSAAGNHLHQLGCTAYWIDSGTFFSIRSIPSARGLMLTSRVRQRSGERYVLEVEINDDSLSYAKAMLAASGGDKEEKNV